MPHQQDSVRAMSSDSENPAPLTTEQALQHLFTVLPYMTVESQASFLTMAFGTPLVSTTPVRLPLAPDVIHGVVQAKTVQQLRESDSAFETKQRTTGKSLKKSGGSMGITKPYQKARKTKAIEGASRTTTIPWDAHKTPYGVPWNIGGTSAPGNFQIAEAAPDLTCFHCWDSKDPSSSVRRYSPA